MRRALQVLPLLALLAAPEARSNEWVPCSQGSDGVSVGRVITQTLRLNTGPVNLPVQQVTRYSVDVTWWGRNTPVRLTCSAPGGIHAVQDRRGFTGTERVVLWEGAGEPLPDHVVQRALDARCWVRE